MNEMQEGLKDGLKKLADDLAKASPPRYCEAHKPCDAKEHQHGYVFAYGIFGLIVGSIIFGLVLMLGVNAVFTDWLGVAQGISYWQSVFAMGALYIIRGVIRGHK
jgi:tetrahydromethanopterin S-methyltransferase subunit B